MSYDVYNLEVKLKDLHRNFVNTVRSRARDLDLDARELAVGVCESIGLEESTTYGKLSPILNQEWGYHFLPKGFEEDQVGNDIKYRSVPRQDPRLIRQTSHLLDHLGVKESDPLIGQIKSLYPTFEYPPQRIVTVNSNSRGNGRTQTTQEGFGDPIVFMRNLALNLGLKLSFEYDKKSHRLDEYISWGGLFLNAYPPQRRTSFGKMGFGVYLENNTDLDNPAFHEFFTGKTDDGRKFQHFNFKKNTMADFGEFVPNVLFGADCWFNSGELFESGAQLGVHVRQDDLSGFMNEITTYTTSIPGKEDATELQQSREFFRANELEGLAQRGDYRPFLHRALEAYAGIPKSQWHDPSIYAGITKLDNVVDSAIDMLFTGDEKERIEKQVAQARLQMRGNWQSVPRLNLGPIQLPNPGQKNIDRDDFVVQATPYLVEYLSHLGVMSREEAERVAARKLTNYFVHRSGFQLSRDRAKAVVRKLKDKTKKSDGEIAA